jgi:endogenous inhibitor of DNA gyrase (YacG/DUF329 family)
MPEVRNCEQCGSRFTPRREHARFCSARCRVAWNRENWNLVNRDQQKWGSENWDDGDRRPGTEPSALGWALVAMRDTTDRLGKVRASDRAQAFAVIGEAVWWVTIVDANLVRYYPDAYDGELASRPEADRQLIDETLAGLRFVRNQVGTDLERVDFIRPAPVLIEESRARDWTWAALPKPSGSALSPRGLTWELGRHQAYQSRLAGQPVGKTFTTAASFLKKVASGITMPDGARALD